MGVTSASWHQDFIQELQLQGISAWIEPSGAFDLVRFEKPGLIINLLSIGGICSAGEAAALQSNYRQRRVQVIQLWEDVWMTRRQQVLSRVCSILGRNQTIHGRKTVVSALDRLQANAFFDRYHLQFSVKARHHYGLFYQGDLVAAAAFSAKRNMTRQDSGYTSVELIRFASAAGKTVQGGLSKLLKHMVSVLQPNDIMSYADLDWSYGNGYIALGFKLTAVTPPATIYLSRTELRRYFYQRLPDQVISRLRECEAHEIDVCLNAMDYYRIFNTGNLKYILYL